MAMKAVANPLSKGLRKPKGTSIIEHGIRIDLNLSIPQYVVADFIYVYNKTYKTYSPTFRQYWTETGLLPEEVNAIIKELAAKQIIYMAKRIELTNRWVTKFNDDAQFDQLWQIYNVGNKQEARENFLACKKIVTFDVLLERLTFYKGTITDPKYAMHLKKFLDPKYKRWEDIGGKPSIQVQEETPLPPQDDLFPTHLMK